MAPLFCFDLGEAGSEISWRLIVTKDDGALVRAAACASDYVEEQMQSLVPPLVLAADDNGRIDATSFCTAVSQVTPTAVLMWMLCAVRYVLTLDFPGAQRTVCQRRSTERPLRFAPPSLRRARLARQMLASACTRRR